ncbi:MAG: short-chain dehydrogenase [Spirochaetae bacterium HGW-Spirochaetae-1]|jgi:short-subunit dehydrogenase|nr:MAG: short-chain dehydrogenase [Spirochaetae bacterium HGW-Spirochaetae-1]
MNLENKKIVLTGASSGIGKAILAELKKHNVQVLVGDLEPKKVETVTGKIMAEKCDVSNPQNIDKLFASAQKKLGGIDIFIANAGFAYYEQIKKSDYDHIEKIYKVNFMAPVYITEKMKELNKGKEYMVVITASAMGKLALPGYALYSSTKAALDSFASAYRYEKDDLGIISLIYPIATKTEFFRVAAGDTTPVPFPAQTPGMVARAVIKGIQKNKKSIFPSKLFVSMMVINRYLPVIFPVYLKIEQAKLFKWLRNS